MAVGCGDGACPSNDSEPQQHGVAAAPGAEGVRGEALWRSGLGGRGFDQGCGSLTDFVFAQHITKPPIESLLCIYAPLWTRRLSGRSVCGVPGSQIGDSTAT